MKDGVNVIGNRNVNVGLDKGGGSRLESEPVQHRKKRSKRVPTQLHFWTPVVHIRIQGGDAADSIREERLSHSGPILAHATAQTTSLSEGYAHSQKQE